MNYNKNILFLVETYLDSRLLLRPSYWLCRPSSYQQTYLGSCQAYNGLEPPAKRVLRSKGPTPVLPFP